MGKIIKHFFIFAYKLIHFILFVPIKAIKYLFLGFFYTFAKVLELLIYTIVLLSFCLYKTLKYICLSFTFPVVIYNITKRNIKTKPEDDQIITVDNEEPITLPDVDDVVLDKQSGNEEIYQFETLNNDDLLRVEDPHDFTDNNIDIEDEPVQVLSDSEDSFEEQKKVEPKKRRKIKIFKWIMLSIELISFLFYKIVKYILLSVTFPYVIYNLIRRNKKENIVKMKDDIDDDIPIEVVSEDISTSDESKFDEELLSDENSEISTDSENNLNDSEIENDVDGAPQLEAISTDMKVVETNNQNKKKFKLLLLLEYISYPVYKIFKYFALGVAYIVLCFWKGFVLSSFGVYKVFKYAVYSLTLPIMVFNFINNNTRVVENRKVREQRRLARHEEKFRKQLENQKRQEDELRQNLKRKRKNEEYINENVKIEKKSFKEQLDEALNYFFNLPKKIADSIKNKAKNSVFAKNRRNRLDINRQALLIDFEGEDAEKSDFKVVYQYTAKNKDGKIITDYFEAFSKVEVHSYLLSEGYEVYNIKTNRWIQFAHKDVAISKVKMKNKDLIFFLTQLSTYIKAGIPLVDSLKIVSRQFTKNRKYKRLFDTVIYDLTMGENFSTALSKQGDAFPKILINMVKASEMTGELPEVLDDMANYFDEMNKTRKQMVTALMYPMIVFVLSVGVIIFIMLFVIPRFVSIYESIDASQIPKFTLAILAISDFLKKYVIHLLVGTLIIVLILRYLYKNIKSFRTICQWLFMHMPVVKNVIIYNEVTTFTKTFASLLGHNVFITDSMEILNRVTNNEIYKMLILDTITNLAKGEKISSSFKDHWAFPVPAYEMLVTGEQTGQLPEMMAKVADYYQELHKNSVARIKTFIEPILIIFLTAVVGAIVLAIVIPMISLYQTVQNYG